MLGITVLPEYLQVEGIGKVLDNCQNVAGATAITTSPYVMELASEGEGQREPPIDAGAGAVRLLDRPLWGKRELFVRTSPSFHPNRDLYRTTSYDPPAGNELTDQLGSVVKNALHEIKSRGLTAFFQIQAAIPPGYRVQFSGVQDQDQPLMPNGLKVENRVAANASLASEDILNYQIALMVDLFQQYPDVDGIRIDWPEYPPYRLDSVFLDFNPQVEQWCRGKYDFQSIRTVVQDAYHWLHGSLSTDVITKCHSPELLEEVLESFGFIEGIKSWLALKRDLVTNYISRIHDGLVEAGFADKLLVPHAFPPPFNTLSGLDYGAVAPFADHIPVKMYTMHWSMIARFYLDQLSAANPTLDQAELVKAIFSLLNISDATAPEKISDVFYPGPSDPQLPTTRVQDAKFQYARRQAGDTPIAALVHAYGPPSEFAQRFATAYRAAGNHAWINRYCYLSDEKLELVGQISRECL